MEKTPRHEAGQSVRVHLTESDRKIFTAPRREREAAYLQRHNPQTQRWLVGSVCLTATVLSYLTPAAAADALFGATAAELTLRNAGYTHVNEIDIDYLGVQIPCASSDNVLYEFSVETADHIQALVLVCKGLSGEPSIVTAE